MSVICTGSAAARCYAAGAMLGNPEFVQVHPTAIPGEDKCRLMSESARGEGGRIWVPKKRGDARFANDIPEEERDYFLERCTPNTRTSSRATSPPAKSSTSASRATASAGG